MGEDETVDYLMNIRDELRRILDPDEESDKVPVKVDSQDEIFDKWEGREDPLW